MNRQTGYICQGVLLALVILAGGGVVNWMLSSRVSPSSQAVVIDYETPAPVDSVFSKGVLRGRKLFMDNCDACHSVEKQIDGPRLTDIEDRVGDRKVLYEWIRNSPAVLKSGNAYFNNLFNQYNKTPMTTFPALTDHEIDNILDYISSHNR